MPNKILLFILLLCCSVVCSAATEDKETNDSVVQLKDRIGVRTNAVNWFLLTPNVGFEYDIIHNKYKKVSLNLSGRYNWNSNFKSTQRYVYNIAGAKAEARWYFRTYKREDWERKWMNSLDGFYDKLQAKKYSIRSRENPRTYRAYYVGPYLSYDKYTLKLSDTGYQGTSIGFGLSLGYDMPLYKYSDGSALDFEFGASAGFIYTGYDEFAYDPDSRCYHHTSTSDNHLVPFPIITDVNLALVYRLKSIREQIVEVDKSKLEMMEKAYELRQKYKENMTVATDSIARINVVLDQNGDTARVRVRKTRVDENGDTISYVATVVELDTIYHRVRRFVDNDSIDIINTMVARKNAEIEEYNALLAKLPEVDSTLYLKKLKPMYRYLNLSDKMLSFGYKKTIPNIRIDSIRKLENKQLNGYLDAYSEIEEGGLVISVEKQMLKDYDGVQSIYFGAGDSLKDISFLEYLVTVIPNINEYSIANHNKKYFGTSSDMSIDVVSSAYLIHGKPPVVVNTLEQNVLDTIYLAEPMHYGFQGENQEIEANNEALKLQTLPLVAQLKAQKSKDAADSKSKKEKSKRKKSKKSKKETVVMADSIAGQILSDSLQNNVEQVLPDSLQNNVEQVLPDSLQNNIEQVLPDSLQNNIEQVLPDSLQNNNGADVSYIFQKMPRRNVVAIEQKRLKTLSARN